MLNLFSGSCTPPLSRALGRHQQMASASKKLLSELPTKDAMLKILHDLGEDTDHAIAITGASYLDRSLEILLSARFAPLTSREHKRLFNSSERGIIGTFSNKVRVAYAIELIAHATYKDLLTINDIRNVFAHTLHSISFKNSLVEQDCANLHIEGHAPPKEAKERYLRRIYSLYEEFRSAVSFQVSERKLLQDRLTLLSKSRAELAEILPTPKAASEGLKRGLRMEGTPYGSHFGPLLKPIHNADRIIERVYRRSDLPRSLGFIPISPGRVPGEEDVPSRGRRHAIRNGACSRSIHQQVN
jgi:hypothetical protein